MTSRCRRTHKLAILALESALIMNSIGRYAVARASKDHVVSARANNRTGNWLRIMRASDQLSFAINISVHSHRQSYESRQEVQR